MKGFVQLLVLFPLYCLGQLITWDKTYELDLQDYGYSIVQANDGGYTLTGYTGDVNSPNLLVMNLASNGDTIWSKIFTDEGHSHGYSICPTTDSCYVVSGFTCNDEYYWNYVMYVLKLNAEGDIIWSKNFGNGSSFTTRPITL